MFNIGTGEIVVIAVFALLVLGPQRLPELARGIGKFLREFRRQTDEVRGVVEREFYKMDQELNAPPPASAPAPLIQPAIGTIPTGDPTLDPGPPPGGLATPAEAAPVGPTAGASVSSPSFPSDALPVPGVDISDPSHPDHFRSEVPPAGAPAVTAVPTVEPVEPVEKKA